ncbi:MAG: 5'-methylthioadenosine/S-adenosylhomocysteine nucleosidase [Puniceicoccales bacterium]|jgi:adenosylhomocysteine nucleosidase|nr:5'-methylthioadenosine/S-adenosylhomocysteine nucleosidase [Puniceicoccales bacterium]
MSLKHILFFNLHLLCSQPEYPSVPKQIESNCSILCVCSQKFELNAILQQCCILPGCKALKQKQYGNITVHYLLYRGNYIALAVTGKNFLSTSQRLFKLFPLLPNVEKVFFVGIGGSLDPKLKPGDVCIPEKWACHTTGYLYNKTSGKTHAVRYEPEHANFKIFYPSSMETGVNSNDEIIRTDLLTCPPSLFNSVQAIVSRSINPTYEFSVNCGGIGVSGTVFVDNDKYRQHLCTTYGAQVVDMESFAFALACCEFQKPFCIIRSISDLAGNHNYGNTLENTIDDHRSEAASNAAIVFTQILRTLPLSTRNHPKMPLKFIKQCLFPPKNPEFNIQNIPHSPKAAVH